MPELSVVISTLGMYDALGRVLHGYSRQNADARAFDVVVVVDQADPSPEKVDELLGERRYPVRRITGDRPGLSANRNAGVRAAAAPLVLFTDNDTIPTPGLISEHLAWHRENPAEEVAVLGHVRWAPELSVTPFMYWLDHGVQFDYPNIRGVDAGWGRFYGANVSVKRGLVERVGGFDQERLPYGYEDLDFAYRASKLGLRVLYNRLAVVDHLRPMTLEFWKRRARRIAAAEHRFVELHPEIAPYYRRMFSHATSRPPARGRGARLIRFVPRWFPVLGPRAWNSADLYFRQAIAPEFLDAWDQAERDGAEGPAQPDVSEREAPSSSGGSSPGG